MNNNFDFSQFESNWQSVCVEICRKIIQNEKFLDLKKIFETDGFLSLEAKSNFIELCDKTKYEVIYGKFGEEGSEGYKKFSQAWRQWFSGKGVESQNGKGQRNNVEHIMYGSTPEPADFIKNAQVEIQYE